MRFFELLSDVPVIHNIIGYISLALNVVLPGSGTVLAACMAEKYVANKTQLAVGLFQILTAVFIIGWCWSIYWGILIVQRSIGDHKELRKLMGNE